jgi:hypothetical protein
MLPRLIASHVYAHTIYVNNSQGFHITTLTTLTTLITLAQRQSIQIYALNLEITLQYLSKNYSNSKYLFFFF